MKTRRVIRDVKLSDAKDLSMVHRAAWLQSYAGILDGAALNIAVNRRNELWWASSIEKVTSEMVGFENTPLRAVPGERRSGLIVLQYQHRVVGYAHYGTSRRFRGLRAVKPWGEIYELYLLPEFQSVGLGRELFHAVKARLLEIGYDRFVIWALRDNDIANLFYQAMGGTVLGQSHELFGGIQMPTLGYSWA
ncbi:MAG: GNAT family N-acetyltransferase [Rhizobiales bacterium]|nr:GNAT family N-acetyltransferase [Hyphomicrobiales bacterium]